MDLMVFVAGVVAVILGLRIFDGVVKRLCRKPKHSSNPIDLAIQDALFGMPCAFCKEGRLHIVAKSEPDPSGKANRFITVFGLQCTSCRKPPEVKQNGDFLGKE